MYKILSALLFTTLSFKGFCSDSTFLLYDMNADKYVVSEGSPDQRRSPCSSFKIALGLIGFEDKILESEEAPVWKYVPELHEKWAMLETHKQDLSPKTWMQVSSVWYSQELTKKLGEKKFQEYIDRLNYGNRDLSGDPGKNNGLTQSWLGSSLEISAKEQMSFICKLVKQELPFSAKAQQLTREIICLGPLGQGWTLYGKTGSGFHKNADGTKNPELWRGWFVGWLEKGDKRFAFVYQINNVKNERGFGGKVAKEEALKRLHDLVVNK